MKLENFRPTTGIYIIKNKRNGKCYVGKSVFIEKRLCEHIYYSDYPESVAYKQWPLHKALKKDKVENFRVRKILYKKEELIKMEKYWIEKMNAIVPNGYNQKR
jgi:group I intron endonuclease